MDTHNWLLFMYAANISWLSSIYFAIRVYEWKHFLTKKNHSQQNGCLFYVHILGVPLKCPPLHCDSVASLSDALAQQSPSYIAHTEAYTQHLLNTE